jgi:hypothetical protein
MDVQTDLINQVGLEEGLCQFAAAHHARRDAYSLVKLLLVGAVPTAYIYPQGITGGTGMS